MSKGRMCSVVPVVLFAAGLMPSAAGAGTASRPAPREWPSDIQAGAITFTIHQPQIESWDGFRATYSEAIASRTGKQDAPLYGVATFSARSSIDKDDRLVFFDDVKVESVRFPSAPAREEDWLLSIQGQVAPMTNTLDLDRFEASLAALDAGRRSEELVLESDPPAREICELVYVIWK